jgi:hypothetical protein
MLKRLSKLVPLMLALLIVTVGLACGESEAMSADQVVLKVLSAQPDAKSMQMSMGLTAEVEGVMEGEAIEGDLTLSGTVDMDQKNKTMYADLDLTTDISGADLSELPSAAGAEMYLVDNYLYAKLSLPSMPDNQMIALISGTWIKLAVPAEITGSIPSMEDIAGLLESSEVEMVGEEKVGGVNCYVLSVTPDFEALQEALASNPLTSQMDIELPDFENFISSMSFKVWVAKDTYFIMKARIVMTVDLTPEALGQPEGEDNLTINVTLNMEASKYNQVPAIQLPTAAESAFDLSSFLQF